MTAAAHHDPDIVSVVNDPELTQHYGGRPRRYQLVGGRRVEDTSGAVWFECRFCDYRTGTAHGVSVHRGSHHPGAANTRSQRLDGAPAEPDADDVVARVQALAARAAAAEAELNAWRTHAQNADAADYLTTAEVAARFRTTTSTIHYWQHMGYGPAGIRVGRRRLYPRAEVSRWEKEILQGGDPA